jgi:hypothetical protein
MTTARRTQYRNALVVLAALLLTNAVLGPAGLDVVAYPLPESLLNQLRGLELVTVGLVVPALVLAAVLTQRDSPAAPLVALGPCGYASYMFVQYVVGPDRTTLSPALLLHLAVFTAATWLAVWSWGLAVTTEWPVPQPAQRRRWAALLAGLAAFVALRYLPLLVGSFSHADIPEEFALAPAFYWSVVLLDLGLVVPAAALAARAALLGSRLAVPATYAVVGWFALVPPSVAAMALVMLVRDDPYASLPTTLLLTVVSVLTTAVAARMFRRLLQDADQLSSSGPRSAAPGRRARQGVTAGSDPRRPHGEGWDQDKGGTP